MTIEQKKFTALTGWEHLKPSNLDGGLFNLVLAFGSTTLLGSELLFDEIKLAYPNATIVLNSTSGEIYDVEVNDETVTLIAIYFSTTIIKADAVQISDFSASRDAGNKLAFAFRTARLRNLLVFSDGQRVNGSELVLGLQECLPKNVIITGGLAGDGARFQKTLVGLNEKPIEGRIVALGFYSDQLKVSTGTAGGWEPFGPERMITKAKKNILYELDGRPALDIYKIYLGDRAKELPAAGLLFPFSIRTLDSNEPIVRTILGVNEKEKTLTFAGNMPENSYARFMKADFGKLINGASLAAQISLQGMDPQPELALLVSCVGRKLVLNEQVKQEVDVVRSTFGPDTAIAGFYSFGEIAPSPISGRCELHNQTMTITTFSERA